MTNAATTATREGTKTMSAGFSATLASEWTKLNSVRSTYIAAGLGIVLSIGMTALITFVIGATMDGWDPEDIEAADPRLTWTFGSIFSAICFSVLGVNFVTSEYSSGMIRQTLATTPRRSRVLFAKVLTLSVFILVCGLISIVGMFFVGQAMLSINDAPTASIGDDGVLRMLVLLILVTPIYPLFGAMLGFLIRGTGGSITAVIGLIFGPSIFGAALPNWWQENVIAYLPGNASDALTISHIDPDMQVFAEIPLAALALVAWIAVFIGVAWLSLTKRDA